MLNFGNNNPIHMEPYERMLTIIIVYSLTQNIITNLRTILKKNILTFQKLSRKPLRLFNYINAFCFIMLKEMCLFCLRAF